MSENHPQEKKTARRAQRPDSDRDTKQPYATEHEDYSGGSAMRPPEQQTGASKEEKSARTK